MRGSMLRVAIAFALWGQLFSSTTWAGPAELLHSPLLHIVDDSLRGLIRITPEWTAIETRRAQIRSAVGGGLVDLFDRQVMTRLREIENSIDVQRRVARGGGSTAVDILFEEPEWISVLVRGRLRMVDELADLSRPISEFLTPERMDFVGLARAGVSLTRQRRTIQFMTEADPRIEGLWRSLAGGQSLTASGRSLLISLAEQATPRTLRSQARELGTYFRRLDHCLRSANAEERSRRQRFFFSTDMGISLGATAIGFIAASGERDLDWATLPLDLTLKIAEKWATLRLAFGTQPWRVRYLYGTIVGGARTMVDYALFTVVPSNIDDLTFRYHSERVPEAQARLLWATGWSGLVGPPSFALDTLLGGWECFSSTPQTRAAITFLRIGNSFAKSYVAYQGREYFYDEVLTER
jgi:hypothetical protein